jgi:hypothetical protein
MRGIELKRHVMACIVLLSSALVVPTAASTVAHGPVARVNANQSSNWFGYNLGTAERSGTLFTQISATWTVPRASLHGKRKNEYSATWIGIGGGCVDAGCTTSDNTLIQAGTESDVNAKGRASYDAWFELIPAPSLVIHKRVSPGDRISVDIRQMTPSPNEVWTIKVRDITKGWRFVQTAPYSSTLATAEWITETPVVINGTGTGVAALPKLSRVIFRAGRVNLSSPDLKVSEEMQLTNGSGAVIGAPSAPDAAGNGFADCAWATTCPTPTG